METIQNYVEVDRLTHLFNNVVCTGHHKDRDCHWYINKVWSYGEKPFYRVEHYGYIYKELDDNNTFDTYEKAEQYMIDQLLIAILYEYDWNLEHKDEADEYDLLDKDTMNDISKMIEDYKFHMRIKEWILLTQS